MELYPRKAISGLLIATLLALPTASAAQQAPPAEEPLSLLGFDRGGKTVLFRRGGEEKGELVYLRRGGASKKLPADTASLVNGHRFGTAMNGGGKRLTSHRGRFSSSLSAAQKISVGVGNYSAVQSVKLPDGCRIEALEAGMTCRRKYALAAVLRLACEQAPATRRVPFAVSKSELRSQALRRYDRLSGRAKLKQAAAALDMVAAISPGATQLYYRRAHLAALGGDTAGAVRWLNKLKARPSAAARRLVVKARWDNGFRLIKDSAAFKAATTL